MGARNGLRRAELRRVRSARHHAARYQAAETTGDVDALLAAAWDDWRVAVREMPLDQQQPELQHWAAALRRRAGEIRRSR
jgi:hypothetical protein